MTSKTSCTDCNNFHVKHQITAKYIPQHYISERPVKLVIPVPDQTKHKRNSKQEKHSSTLTNTEIEHMHHPHNKVKLEDTPTRT